MSTQTTFFFLQKYTKCKQIKTSAGLFNVEKKWLMRYITSDGRFTFRANRLVKDYFVGIKNCVKRSTLRSTCLFSAAHRGVSGRFFWLGRHAFNKQAKKGWLVGFKKC